MSLLSTIFSETTVQNSMEVGTKFIIVSQDILHKKTFEFLIRWKKWLLLLKIEHKGHTAVFAYISKTLRCNQVLIWRKKCSIWRDLSGKILMKICWTVLELLSFLGVFFLLLFLMLFLLKSSQKLLLPYIIQWKLIWLFLRVSCTNDYFDFWYEKKKLLLLKIEYWS